MYRLRVTDGFFADVRAGWEHFRQTASEDIADQWQESLVDALRAVLQNPLGYGLALEYERFKHPVRRLLHQRTPSAPTYRILYFLEPPITDEDGGTTTLIVVFAALHASAKPLSTRAPERRP